MKSNNSPVTVVVLINIVGHIGVCISLVVAFYYQVVMYELPCPLCLLQRVGLIIAGFGFLFNICFGQRNMHYGMVIFGCILTGVMASRQIFLHIMPDDLGYGSKLLGIHFYTWALIASVVIIAATAVVLSISEARVSGHPLKIHPGLSRIACWGFLLLIAANLTSTILECGSGQCDDNPIIYKLLSK